jgi:hypothetical protein
MSLGVNSGVSPPTQIFQSFSQKVATGIFISVENQATLTDVSSLRQRFLFPLGSTRTPFAPLGETPRPQWLPD